MVSRTSYLGAIPRGSRDTENESVKYNQYKCKACFDTSCVFDLPEGEEPKCKFDNRFADIVKVREYDDSMQ